MKTDYKYEVKLWEDKIEKDQFGQVIHHPLNSRYNFTDRNNISYGYLTFAGHNLAKSTILDNVRVFYLQFFGEANDVFYQEDWANPLRIEVLRRLNHKKHSWYLSFTGDVSVPTNPLTYIPIEEDLQQNLLKDEQLDFVIVQSEKMHGYGQGFEPRLFFESSDNIIPYVVNHYWSQVLPGFTIEGYNINRGQVQLLQQWDKKPRDAQLFREVMDQTFITFYTFPAENRDFVFVTNKLNLEDIEYLLDIKELQQRAENIK